MKKLIFAMLICIVAGQVLASGTPLRGEKTIDPADSGPDNYISFAAAINDLNENGVGTDGVIFNVPAGLTFTLTAALPAITVQGTEDNPVYFQKMGTGDNPLVTFAGTGGSSDYIFKLEGAKYVTFDGIDVANTTGSTALEHGYWIISATGNGSSHNTIKNCSITLSGSNANSKGIFATHTNVANDNNLFKNIHVVEAYSGIVVKGTSSLYGLNSSIEGCLVENFSAEGIKADYQVNATIFDNQINFPNSGNYNVILSGIDSYALTDSAISNNTLTGGNVGGPVFPVIFNAIFMNEPQAVEVHHNTITGITINTARFIGIYASLPKFGLMNFHHNNIYNISSSRGFWGFYTMRGYDLSFSDNHIYSVESGSDFYGMHVIENRSLEYSSNIFNNHIHDVLITNDPTGVCSAINAQDVFANIFNNMIYDIRVPNANSAGDEPHLSGISLKDLQPSQSEKGNVYNNSVFLDAVGMENFRSSAIYSSFSGPMDIKNNIFVNLSDPGTTGKAVAFWKRWTDFDNYVATMDKNIYYAGTPSPNNLIHFNYDGETTNSAQTLAEYKALNVGKDQNSYTENVPFVSSVEPYDLHINPNIPTNVEGNGIYLPSVLIDDIDGDLRSETPDIGADEGDFTPMGGGTVLDIPTNLSILNLDDNIMISWDAVDGAAGYYVYASDAPYADAPWGTPIFTVDAPLTSISIPADTQYKFFYVSAFE